MSKKSFKKAMTGVNRVYAEPSKAIKDSKGKIVKQLYNLYVMR